MSHRNTSLLAAAALACCTSLALADAGTLFVHQFDGPLGTPAGNADFAIGNHNQLAGPPDGPGGSHVAGLYGNALARSAPGGRVQFATGGNYNVQRGTIEMWINYPSFQSFAGLWGTVQGGSATPGDVRMYLYNAGSGNYGFGGYMTDAGGAAARWECENSVPGALAAVNTWHHVAWTWDTAAATTAIYWDGQQLRNTPDVGTVNVYDGALPAQMHIGENQLGSATFNGLIDSFRISDVVRYTGNFAPPSTPFASVPEPSGLALAGLAVGGLFRRRGDRRA